MRWAILHQLLYKSIHSDLFGNLFRLNKNDNFVSQFVCSEYPELPTYLVLANFADYDAWLDVTPLYNRKANLTVVASAAHSAHRIG